ncbi:hypothetical protein BY996DRAFT_7265070 [Phakopsora pachyrhizi]|nr:hypothetical protein BY996DRAFT_7265070 [Phakopsora pachyrhizi]
MFFLNQNFSKVFGIHAQHIDEVCYKSFFKYLVMILVKKKKNVKQQVLAFEIHIQAATVAAIYYNFHLWSRFAAKLSIIYQNSVFLTIILTCLLSIN